MKLWKCCQTEKTVRKMSEQIYDLIIVGAGPSGSSAGRIAGKKGLKTLILEKEIFPRYKPCGGALSPHARSYLDFEIPEEIINKSVFKGKLRFMDKSVEYQRNKSIYSLVTRSIFDNFLLEKARETGVDVIFGEKVTDISQDKDKVKLVTRNASYESRFVIIASGAMASLKNHVRKPDNKEEYGVCLVTEITEAPEGRCEDLVEIDFGTEGMGYGWIFPHNGYYSVGAGGIMAKYSPHPKKTMEKFLKDNGFTGNYKLKGHVLPCGGHKRKLVKGRVLLSGDAAGFVDALTGEGLPYAIRTGQIAAEVVSRNTGNIRELNEYEKRCYAEFGEHLRYSVFLSKQMYNHPGKVFDLLMKNNELLDMYIEVSAYNKTYKDFVKKFMTGFRPSWLKR